MHPSRPPAATTATTSMFCCASSSGDPALLLLYLACAHCISSHTTHITTAHQEREGKGALHSHQLLR